MEKMRGQVGGCEKGTTVLKCSSESEEFCGGGMKVKGFRGEGVGGAAPATPCHPAPHERVEARVKNAR